MKPIHPMPSTNPVRLGSKLRATRKAQGLTIEQVACTTGLSKGFISRVERDDTSPSVATLFTLCQVLSLPVGSLFEAPEVEVVALADAPLINMGGTGTVERLITPRAESRLQVLRSHVEAHGSGGIKLYTINCDVEAVHMLSGRVVIRFAGEEIILDEGDTLTFGGREPHSWHNPDEADAEMLWILVPAAWSGSS